MKSGISEGKVGVKKGIKAREGFLGGFQVSFGVVCFFFWRIFGEIPAEFPGLFLEVSGEI